jgi:hypothetical protein
MSQRLSIDLKKNPEVAELISDMEPGAKVNLTTAIYSKDEQTLVLELEEAEAGTEAADDLESNDDNADDGMPNLGGDDDEE